MKIPPGVPSETAGTPGTMQEAFPRDQGAEPAPMRTVGAPAAMALTPPFCSTITSPTRAAGRPFTNTEADPVLTGPPTCGRGGLVGVESGQEAKSPTRAAGRPPTNTFELLMPTTPPWVVGSPTRAAGAAGAAAGTRSSKATDAVLMPASSIQVDDAAAEGHGRRGGDVGRAARRQVEVGPGIEPQGG